ncbi:retention module-containing protein [Congregibacter variabilis]|uniref:Retention module-containing protein n=1 Tax=Congregibacter variabilis TaxID=3081200 RepID=A0ABZ0I872_9GAMM|nr:retention module-containing protein [Congregibacter sp. IMCC43200]
MAQQIGTVEKLQGTAFARAEDGSQRQLQIGDAIFQGEVLVTEPGAVLEVAVADAPSIVMPGGRELLVTGELLAETRDTAADASVIDDTIATIVETLENGGDLLDNLDAPAAGGPGQDEGSSFVRLGRIGFDLPEFATLDAGTDADRINPDEPAIDNDLQLLLDDSSGGDGGVDPGGAPPAPPVVLPPPPPPPVNLAPVAEPDTYSGEFASAVIGNVLDNDSDPESEALSVVGNTEPANGTVVLNPDGSFIYEPNDGFSGEDSFEYTITDENGNTDTTVVTINVAEEVPTTPPVTPPLAPPAPPVNVGPVAGNDSQTLSEDTPITINVLGNDSDSDGSLIPGSVSIVGGPVNGTVTVNANGTVTYTPNADYAGADSFTYTVTDNDGAVSNVATVNLTIDPVDDSPVSVDLEAQSSEDADAVSVDVSGNFTDVDSTLTYSATGLPAGLSIDPATGVISGTIDNSASQLGGGVYSVTVTATDGVNPSVSESFDWTVSNPGPDAVDDTQGAAEDTALDISVLANDTDVDGDTLSIVSFTQPTNGTVTDNGDGTLKYTPNANYNGPDSFTYTISDGEGGSDTATVNLTVTPDNDPPVSVGLSPVSSEDAEVVSVDVGSNFSDVDSTLTYSASGLPAGLSIDPATGVIFGTIDNSASQDGTAGVYNVVVTATDGVNTPVSESFDWTVTNPGPTANDDTGSTDEDVAVIFSPADLLGNDSDPDGDDLGITSVGTATNGTVVLNGDGTVTFTPNADYNGPASFEYTISDGEGGESTATVNLTVNAVNDPPVVIAPLGNQANDDADAITPVDASTAFNDVDSTLTYSASGLPLGLSIDPATGVISGTIDNSASQDGTAGVYSVVVTATDGVNPSVNQSFDWTVTNPGPTANDDTGSTDEDVAVTFNPVDLLGNDSDPDGDDLSITSVGSPTNGTVDLNSDGTVTFTPTADYNGPASFEYTISDGEGGESTATVNLTVDAVNDPPVVIAPLGNQANDDADDVASVDTSVAFNDVDSTLTYSASGLPAGLSIDPATGVISGTIDNSASQLGGGVYNVVVTATDGVNPSVSQSFDWTVTNPGPTANDDTGSTDEDVAAIFTPSDLLGNDSDPDGDDLSITSVGSPTNGTVDLNSDGTVTFTPTADYSGPASFEYTISDGEGGESTATVNLTVNAVNDPPVVIAPLGNQANDDADAITPVDASTAFNDVDSTLTYSASGLPLGLSIDPATGIISGTIDNSASQDGTAGVYNVTVTATDGVNPSVNQSFDWTVTNPGPTANDDTGSTDEDVAVTFNPVDLLGNDSDPDGDDLSITSVGSPTNGTVDLNSDGTVTFTPTADYNGPASFEYTISDGEGGESTATVNLTVNAVNDPPVVIAPLGNQANDDADDVASVDTSVAFNDVDSTLTYSASGLPLGLSIDPATGVISGTIDNSASQDGTAGVYNVVVTATDGVNPSVSQSFDWTVTNPGPTANDDSGSTDEDVAVIFNPVDLLGNDSDPDGDDLSITSVGSPTNGTVDLNSDGTVTFTPTADYSGPASFEYTISDGEGGESTATVNLTVNAVNDPPVVIAPLGNQANDDADDVASVDTSVAFNDVDSTLTYSATGLPAGLTIDSATGIISGTIDNSASQDGTAGVYNVMVTATDGVNPSVSQSFDWTVTNPGPTANDDSGSTDEDVAVIFNPVDLLGNDSDPDGDDLSITSVGTAINGTVVLNGDGTVTFTPTADYNGPASFEYTIIDGEGGESTATVNLTVNAVNDPPVVIAPLGNQANDDADAVASVDTSVAFNDVDSTLTYSATGLPAGLSIDPATGVISGTIDNSASQLGGGVYNVTVTATDGVNPSVNQSFDWTVTNPGPTATDDTGSTDEDVAVTFNPVDLLGNDSDPDGDDLSIASVGTAINGTVVLNGDGTVTFTPTADYNGPASFEYTISDGEGGESTATVNLTVNAVNDPPESDAKTLTVAEDTSANAVPTLTGSDSDGTVESFVITGLPANGTLLLNGVAVTTVGQTISVAEAGNLTYTPNPDYFGDDSFSYASVDDDGTQDATPATVAITVTDVAEPPAPNVAPDSDAKTLTVAEDTSANAVPTLTGSDSDGTVESFVITGLPANGTLLLNGVAVTTVGQTISVAEAGNLTYTPNPDYFGDDSFSYASVDDDGAQDATPASVAITVTDVAEPDTTPTADSLTALAALADGPGRDGTLTNPQVEVFFDVDGIVDGTGLESTPTLGGVDNETQLDDLVFTLRSTPIDGTLYLDANGDGSYTQAQAGDTFDSGSSLYWAKPAEQVVQDLSTDASGVTVSGFNGRNAQITQSSSGLGVDSAGNTQQQAPEQLGYRNGSSETMVLNLGGPVTEATVRIERLFPNEGEAGRVEALDANGSVIGSWTFYGRANATLGGVPVDFNIGGSGGSFTLSDVGQPFYALRFTATPYVDGVTQGTGKNADSSDYLVKSVAYAPISFTNAQFTYDVTDEQGNVSDPATVIIEQSSAPIALDLDDDGVEYLSRDAGVIFTDQVTGESVNTAWVAPDDGLLVIDANQSGTVDETREYVFTEWSENAETDMEAVAEVFDTNQNSQLDPGDEAWSQFAVWQDADSDGVTDEGELRSLDDLGVESIDLSYTEDSASGIAADGDVAIHGRSNVTWTDGSVTTAEDASFAIDIADVLVDHGTIDIPVLAQEAGDVVIEANDTAAPASASGDAAQDIAAMEIDLLLNMTTDEKPESGSVD